MPYIMYKASNAHSTALTVKYYYYIALCIYIVIEFDGLLLILLLVSFSNYKKDLLRTFDGESLREAKYNAIQITEREYISDNIVISLFLYIYINVVLFLYLCI